MKITEQLYVWHYKSLRRYGLWFPSSKLMFGQFQKTGIQAIKSIKTKPYLNHPAFWMNLEKGIIHCNSQKLLKQTAYYGPYNLALSCIGAQTPCLIRTKQSVAGFKMFKDSPIGALNNLRKKRLIGFCYKWTFLSAAGEKLAVEKETKSIGISNLFIFPELDLLDYYAFEPLPGLEVGFH